MSKSINKIHQTWGLPFSRPLYALPSPRVFELRVSNSLARHGVPAVVEAVRHVENDRGVVGQEVVANLIENLWRVSGKKGRERRREEGEADVKRRL